MSPEEAPTPPARSATTVDKWPMFERLARELALKCHLEAERRMEVAFEVGDWKRGEAAYEHIRTLRSIASDGRAIAAAFAAWSIRDPGGDLRRQAIAKLLDMREAARELGVTVPV